MLPDGKDDGRGQHVGLLRAHLFDELGNQVGHEMVQITRCMEQSTIGMELLGTTLIILNIPQNTFDKSSSAKLQSFNKASQQ